MYITPNRRNNDDNDGRRVLSVDSPPVTVPRILYKYIYTAWNSMVLMEMIVKRARKPTDPYVVYILTNINTSVPPWLFRSRLTGPHHNTKSTLLIEVCSGGVNDPILHALTLPAGNVYATTVSKSFSDNGKEGWWSDDRNNRTRKRFWSRAVCNECVPGDMAYAKVRVESASRRDFD